MDAYSIFVMIAFFCIVFALAGIGVIVIYDDNKHPIKGRIIFFIAFIAVGSINGFINYKVSESLQKTTIKRCYYNGISVKVKQNFYTDSNGNLIENKADSIFYINETRE